MKIPLHVRFRKKLNIYLLYILSKLTKTVKNSQTIDKNEITSIVIVRPNYRIGNIIFLTPLINEIHKEMPLCKIDVVVGMKLAGNILKGLPNIDRVIDTPRSLLLNPISLYKLIKTTRAKKYDLAIDTSGGSVSSQIVTTLINAKYKVSFESEKLFMPLTHTVKSTEPYTHAGSKALELLKVFGNPIPSTNIELDIKLTPIEIETAQNALDKLLGNNHKSSQTIALFRNARFDKKIPDEWWQEWHKELMRLDCTIVVIDILSPDILTKLNDKCLEYSNKDLRALGAFFSVCDAYISADTGPLHISIASQANTLALFNKTSKEHYGTLSSDDMTIDINGQKEIDIAKITNKYLNKA